MRQQDFQSYRTGMVRTPETTVMKKILIVKKLSTYVLKADVNRNIRYYFIECKIVH